MTHDGNPNPARTLLLGHDPEDDFADVNFQTGCIQLAIKSGEHKMGICRRMIAFALLVPRKFVQFVEEERPRALVILAHFFALASDMEDIWWVAGTARREVLGIQQVLPPEWQWMMESPMESVT
jgi:hypothetical protein